MSYSWGGHKKMIVLEAVLDFDTPKFNQIMQSFLLEGDPPTTTLSLSITANLLGKTLSCLVRVDLLSESFMSIALCILELLSKICLKGGVCRITEGLLMMQKAKYFIQQEYGIDLFGIRCYSVND